MQDKIFNLKRIQNNYRKKINTLYVQINKYKKNEEKIYKQLYNYIFKNLHMFEHNKVIINMKPENFVEATGQKESVRIYENLNYIGRYNKKEYIINKYNKYKNKKDFIKNKQKIFKQAKVEIIFKLTEIYDNIIDINLNINKYTIILEENPINDTIVWILGFPKNIEYENIKCMENVKELNEYMNGKEI